MNVKDLIRYSKEFERHSKAEKRSKKFMDMLSNDAIENLRNSDKYKGSPKQKRLGMLRRQVRTNKMEKFREEKKLLQKRRKLKRWK